MAPTVRVAPGSEAKPRRAQQSWSPACPALPLAPSRQLGGPGSLMRSVQPLACMGRGSGAARGGGGHLAGPGSFRTVLRGWPVGHSPGHSRAHQHEPVAGPALLARAARSPLPQQSQHGTWPSLWQPLEAACRFFLQLTEPLKTETPPLFSFFTERHVPKHFLAPVTVCVQHQLLASASWP